MRSSEEEGRHSQKLEGLRPIRLPNQWQLTPELEIGYNTRNGTGLFENRRVQVWVIG